MCILLVSKAHKDYAIVLLSNRDEHLSRPTRNAYWWPQLNILAPQDQLKNGTWMGITKTGRIAGLVNFHCNPNDRSKVFSRGSLPPQFLTSSLEPQKWVDEMHSTRKESMQVSPGFSMVCLTVNKNIEASLLSNRQATRTILTPSNPTLCISNGDLDDKSWTKTTKLQSDFEAALTFSGAEFEERLFEMLTKCSFPENPGLADLKESVFITPVEFQGLYGTRTQTLVLVDRKGGVQYIERDVASGKVERVHFDIDREGGR